MKRKTKKIIKNLALHHGVRVRFLRVSSTSSLTSAYDKRTKTLYIIEKIGSVYSLGYTMISTFFHELGHHHCSKNGIWKIYHDLRYNDRSHYRFALKAEIWVDNWAEKKFKESFPNGYYGKYFDPCYPKEDKEENKKFFKYYYLSEQKVS